MARRRCQSFLSSISRADRTKSEGLLLESLTCHLHGQEVYLHSWVVADARYVERSLLSCNSSGSFPRIDLYMRRPKKENYRLDRLLKRKAEEGVMVYVIV